MIMKTKILLLTAALATLLLPYSCEKQPKTPKEKAVEFTIEVSDIAIQTATISVTATGEPTLVRMVDATPLSSVLAEVGSLDDADAVNGWITRNGSAIVLPYSSAAKDLDPSTEYFVGVVAYNKNMDIVASKTATFTTLETGAIVIGGGSGAGSVNENTL